MLSERFIIIKMEPLKNMPKLTYADEKREVEFQRPKAFLKFQMKTKLNTCMSAAVSNDALPVECKSLMA